MKKLSAIFMITLMLGLGAFESASAGNYHHDKRKVEEAKKGKNHARAAVQYCTGEIESSGDGTGLLRCGAAVCQAEYPAGQTSSFECENGKCPIKNATYGASCQKYHFLSGCTVTYKNVTDCK